MEERKSAASYVANKVICGSAFVVPLFPFSPAPQIFPDKGSSHRAPANFAVCETFFSSLFLHFLLNFFVGPRGWRGMGGKYAVAAAAAA